jgi:hypothetical protein
MDAEAPGSGNAHGTALALRIAAFDLTGPIHYALGNDVLDGRGHRVALPRLSPDSRGSMAARSGQVRRGGVVVFRDCRLNANGTSEARGSTVVASGPEDIWAASAGVAATVGPVLPRDAGTSVQQVHVLLAHEAIPVVRSDEAAYAIQDLLSRERPGRPGAFLRGVDAMGNAIAARVDVRWDRETTRELSPEESLALFRSPPIKVEGAQDSSGGPFLVTGAAFLGYLDSHPEVSREAIPAFTAYRYSSASAQPGEEASGVGFARDLSVAYLVRADRPFSGYRPSLVALTRGRNAWFAKEVLPAAHAAAPLPLPFVPSSASPPGFAQPPDPPLVAGSWPDDAAGMSVAFPDPMFDLSGSSLPAPGDS